MALSATRVRALREPGRYSDGGGLHLFISRTERKSWVLRITIDGRRRDIGVGGFPSVGLAQAREKAGDIRSAVAEGRDPLAERHAPAMPTFREAARAVHEANTGPAGATSSTERAGCRAWNRHVMPILGNTPLDRIDRGDVLRVLTPIWTTRPETARRVRQRMTGRLPLGDGPRLHGDQPSWGGHRWSVAPDAEGEGPPQSSALPRGPGGTGDRGGFPGLDSGQAVLPVPGPHGGPLR